MSADSWERRKADFALPLLQWAVAQYLNEPQVTDTIRRLILSDPSSQGDDRNLALILRDILIEGITVNHHYATVLNLYRRRAGKSWLNPVAETHELTLRALACVAPDSDKVSEGDLEGFLPTAMALFEILNSNDAEVNVDEVDRLLARLWRSDHNVALSVYGKTSFKETFYEAASELLDAGAKPLKVIGLLADALQTRHMEVGSGYSILKKVKRSVKGSVLGREEDPPSVTPPASLKDVPTGEGETPSEMGGPKKKRKKVKGDAAMA
jgi:hypothetical protein